MRIKKILSVFLAILMLFSVTSVGMTGVAAEIDYNAQYRLLAEALKNEHVRDLSNYTVTNKKLDNGAEGYDPVGGGFAYDHKVVAADDINSSILKASNRFFFIAESLMSYKYGVGCYDSKTLVEYVLEKLKPHFASTSSGEKIYEDFYGERFYPTAEQLEAYNNAASLIVAAGGQVNQGSLTEYGIYFIEMDDWAYYNVETIIKYFVGNVVLINSGNWYHRFSFVVETSVDRILEQCDGIDSFNSNVITIRTAAYQFTYNKFYNETASKAYFAFAESSLNKVWNSYGEQHNLTNECADLAATVDGKPGILRDGQASAYLINVTVDEETVSYLRAAAATFDKYIKKSYNSETGEKWDSQFITWTDATITNSSEAPVILGYAAQLSTQYSNDALLAVFGNRLGNMVTLAYLLKTSRSVPTRTVRGEAIYEATPDKLDEIIDDLDALISPRLDGSDKENDIAVSNRVAAVVSSFLDVGGMLGVEVSEYTTLEELIGLILSDLVFSDAIINMLVELVYPMIVSLIIDNLGGIDVIGGVAVDLVGSILDNNKLAIYPNKLGDLLITDHGEKYRTAATILQNGGSDWANVNFAALVWGVDTAPVNQKKEVFIEALCAALGGFTRLLVTFLCGDAEYENKDADERFGKNYDLGVVSIGIEPLAVKVWLASQGLYTKLFIPLYRVLGLTDGRDFLSSAAFHAAIAEDFTVCLELAITPIVNWVTDYVAKRPFETIMRLIPNLVHFLSRKGGDLPYANDWAETGHGTTDNQYNAHRDFASLQTHNLWSILENVHLKIIAGIAYPIGSIASLIGSETGAMLTSLNGLLNEVISLKYDTDVIHEKKIACYYDNNGNIVLPDSTEYAVDPAAYPNASMFYYADASNTKFSLEQDDEHPFLHENITYVQKNFYLPAIPEAKLLSCGTPNTYNTIDVENPGLVFLFLLRYVMSALGYRYDLSIADLPSLIECLGLDLSGELFMGLTLGDIINNIMIHPDEAICALLELFYSNETGDLYDDKPYTYPLTNINYYEKTLLNKAINPTQTYGAEVRYSQYWTKEYANEFVSSLGPLVEDVLVMLGIEGMEDGLGPFLKNMVNDMLFTNELADTLFNLIYQLLGGLNDSLGMDIESILDNVLDVSFKPADVARALNKIIGHDTEASRRISAVTTWSELFTVGYEVDPVTGEETPITEDVHFDWGIDTAEEHGHSRGESFLKTVSALLSPVSFVIKFLFMDKDLDILGLIKIPGYAGYQYAFIGLLEALSCPDILSYDDYYEAAMDSECGDANTIYYLFAPILGLLEKAYADPVNTILGLIPNLLFFISIGGLNGLVNNLVHFAYVLIDILKPIINAYDLLGGLLANIDLGGMNLNLTLPLDIDFNTLISDLVDSLLGDTLTIEGVSLKLPYIDLYSLCVGTLERFISQEGRTIVRLSPGGGGEFLTALLRIVFEVLFMEENHEALSQIVSNLAGEGKLDAYDEETLYQVIDALFGLIEEYEALDIVLFAVYMLITKLVPIADTLAPRFAAAGITITDLIDSAADTDLFIANLSLLLKDPDQVEYPDTTTDTEAIGSLFGRLKAFFEKIKLFFQRLFTFG